MNVESFFPGRIRVSSDLFTRPENMARVTDEINAVEGIREVNGNIRTGSITIVYDTGVISMSMLMEAKSTIEQLEKELG